MFKSFQTTTGYRVQSLLSIQTIVCPELVSKFVERSCEKATKLETFLLQFCALVTYFSFKQIASVSFKSVLHPSWIVRSFLFETYFERSNLFIISDSNQKDTENFKNWENVVLSTALETF